ncbi:MAG: aromatic-ring-hydroxylating dioxygenase subunit beta [Vulcanimicrobiaceae bacterium]
MSLATELRVEERVAIEDLYGAYVRALDERRFDEWPELFTDECTYRIVARENFERGLPLSILAFESKGMLRDRVYSITQTLFHAPYRQRHQVSGLYVRALDSDRFAVEANYLVIRTKRAEPSEILSTGRYQDVIVRDGGALKFKEKVCIFDCELIPNSIIYPI